MERRVVVPVYPDLQVLDVTGPLEVFSLAGRFLGAREGYATTLVARVPGPMRCSSALELGPVRPLGAVRGAVDTLLVPGGEGTRAAAGDRLLVAWIRRAARQARRVVSVCSGSFLLAEAGLLDGRRATTHWAACDEMARRYPQVRVEPDPIYVRDGNVWTSAGITAGMDLALALVEQDHGRALALQVARHLVFFLKRPGGQSQFSAQLEAQLAERAPLAEVQAWIAERPAADLSVAALAERCGMSPRNFARVFQREIGTTPARFVENARVECARRRLEEGDAGVEEIAGACGFGTAETMRRAFLRRLRVSPAEYRSRFRGPARPERRTA